MKYELDSYIPEDDILHSHRRENLKSYILFDCNYRIFEAVVLVRAGVHFHFCLTRHFFQRIGL
jgi:hypothetical protein